MGKRLTRHAHEAGTIHDVWDYIVHNVLPVLELPLDDHRCVAWLGGIFDKAAGKWWSHRVQTIPAVAAVPAVAAAGGNPAVAAVAARAAGGYATVAEMRDGFLDAFKFEPAHTVASRKFDTLKCTTHKHIHDFNTSSISCTLWCVLATTLPAVTGSCSMSTWECSSWICSSTSSRWAPLPI